MAIYDAPVQTLAGEPASLRDYAGKVLLVVNVASKCGLTPQYAGLEELQRRYGDEEFSVLGFPCNQFGGQEPGTAEEIATFCSQTYDVTFPIFAKVDVNGAKRTPLYDELTSVPDSSGDAGDVQWNFEKFLISKAGDVLARFRPRTTPDDPAIVTAIDKALSA